MPEYTAVDTGTPASELPVLLGMLGKVADFLRAADLSPAERAALDQGVTVRRGQGYTLRTAAVPALHRRLLDLCQALDGTAAVPAQRKAGREYENRVNRHTQSGPDRALDVADDCRPGRVPSPVTRCTRCTSTSTSSMWSAACAS